MPVSVDKEWAKSFIGLRMQVEEGWWDGCSCSTLYPGQIAAFREAEKTDVLCSVQQRDYSETFHLIDKGNGKESNYDMGGQTKGHNWAPKLTMRYWNFGLGNAHTMYAALVKKFTPDRRALDMPGCVKILTHYLLQ